MRTWTYVCVLLRRARIPPPSAAKIVVKKTGKVENGKISENSCQGPSISGMSSSSSPSSQLSDFSATSASDFNIGRVMHNLECVRAWQKTTQSRIDDAMEWKREMGPVLAELLEYQRNSALSIKALNKELEELRSTLTGVAEVSQTTPSETLRDCR